MEDHYKPLKTKGWFNDNYLESNVMMIDRKIYVR